MARDVGNGIQQSDQLYSRKGTIVFQNQQSYPARLMPIPQPRGSGGQNHTFFGKKIYDDDLPHFD